MSLKIGIVETGNGLVAQVLITDPEFDDDLARVKRIPYEDRKWKPESRQWLIFNAQKYAGVIPEIKRAIEIYKRQLKLF